MAAVMSTLNRYVLRIMPVDKWPVEAPQEPSAYAYVAERDLDSLARRLASQLKAEVVTPEGLYTSFEARAPNHPPVPSEELP